MIIFWFVYYTPSRQHGEVGARIVPALRLLKNRFVSRLLFAKIFVEPVWYFVTFWIARYLADVHHWKLKEIGWYAVIPFIMADVGNIVGGYFTQVMIRRGVATPQARRVSLAVAGVLMVLPLLMGPWVIGGPMSALIVLGLAGFGYTSYTANSLALTADVVPQSSTASAWGLACIGNGIGGAVFQSLSGVVVKKVSAVSGYVFAYNVLFLGFGVSVLVGMIILLFFAGSFTKSGALHEYAEGGVLSP